MIKVGDILELPGVYELPILVRVTEVTKHIIGYNWLKSSSVGYFSTSSPLVTKAKQITLNVSGEQ